jgi:acyl-CoA synthetase (AMP-forming)/AMP-acid ligase II
MIGYLGISDPFEDGMFASGDLGTLSSDGMLCITGRKKDLIIRGGFNISPGQIEEVLARHPAVDCVAVLGTPHEFYGEEGTAVVQLAPGTSLMESQPALVKLCTERLSSICIPTRFLDLGKLPVTITGKVKKSQVRELIQRLPNAA